MNSSARLAAMDVNLDDLQAGVEACSRMAKTLHDETAKCNGLLNASLSRSILRHARDLLAFVGEQRAVVEELRHAIAALRTEYAQRPPHAASPTRHP